MIQLPSKKTFLPAVVQAVRTGSAAGLRPPAPFWYHIAMVRYQGRENEQIARKYGFCQRFAIHGRGRRPFGDFIQYVQGQLTIIKCI